MSKAIKELDSRIEYNERLLSNLQDEYDEVDGNNVFKANKVQWDIQKVADLLQSLRALRKTMEVKKE